MYTFSTVQAYFRILAVTSAILVFLSIAESHANQTNNAEIPAFLPLASDVPISKKLPIDGEWMINNIRKRIRIEGGRAYAVDPWLHLFILKIQPQMVVSKDWQRISPGQYSGQDLPLVGPFTASVLSNGNMNIQIQGMFGVVNLTLSPISLDNQLKFELEKPNNESTTIEPQSVVYGFDGTGKNMDHGEQTNVFHFLKAHRSSEPSVKNVYASGVGSNNAKKYGFSNLSGVFFGKGGKEIVELMYKQLIKNYEKGHTGIVIVGFSRGAALSREFANVINERGDPLMYKKLNRPYGKAPTIKFMGLFDTVYSFGSPFGKNDLGYRKHIPANVHFVAQATAKLEKRNTFDLWSIHSSKLTPKTCPTSVEGDNLDTCTGSTKNNNYRIEKEFEAGHDDVGGAEKNNHNGYEPLKWILTQAQASGVLIEIPSRSEYETVPNNAVDPIGDGIGKRQIYYPNAPNTIPAIYYDEAKNGCEGMQVYISGTKCYECPNGYKRYSFTRKMTHPEACIERGLGFGKDKTVATYVWGANGCPRYQFKYKGICLKCPAGTSREHVAGIDTGQCKVD